MKGFIKKLFKGLMIVVVGVVIAVNAFIILTGRFYLYKGIANTYMKGRSGPSIYDLNTFPNKKINNQGQSYELNIHPNINKQTIPKEYRQYIEDLDTRALLIMKNDSLIYEEYWSDHDKETMSNSFSIAKTVVSLLISIAVEEGFIESLDQPVYKFIPEFNDGSRDVITIRHLLQMSSGLSWTESSANPLSDNAESYYGTDLEGLVKRQKRVNEPGEMFLYQSGNSQLLAMIVSKATGVSVSEYAQEKLWSKLGMESEAFWSLDKEGGTEKAFCCLYARARDYTRLGRCILNKGMHEGEQIFPRWYYHEMIRPSDLTTEDNIPNYRYGLHIWTFKGYENEVYYCRGIRGQFIISIPEENLLIVRLGSKRKDDFQIPDHLKNEVEYVEKNKYHVGHCLGLFQYIAIGKLVAAQTNDL